MSSITACGIPPTATYNIKSFRTFLCATCPNGFKFKKQSLIISAVMVSPLAHKNSSKSSGYIFIDFSSLGIKIFSTFCFNVMSEPVSI